MELSEIEELIGYLVRTSRLSVSEARRLVGEVLSFLGETPEDFVRRRHRALQAEGLANPQIFAANFHSGAIEVYDTNFKPVTLAAGAFVDSAVPAGYGPFNIWNLGGKLYVMWAQQNTGRVSMP